MKTGAEPNTSCLKKTDARVESKMRALGEKRERERRDGGRQKTILRRKKTPTESVINKWREHKVVIQGRRGGKMERQKEGLW